MATNRRAFLGGALLAATAGLIIGLALDSQRWIRHRLFRYTEWDSETIANIIECQKLCGKTFQEAKTLLAKALPIKFMWSNMSTASKLPQRILDEHRCIVMSLHAESMRSEMAAFYFVIGSDVTDLDNQIVQSIHLSSVRVPNGRTLRC